MVADRLLRPPRRALASLVPLALALSQPAGAAPVAFSGSLTLEIPAFDIQATVTGSGIATPNPAATVLSVPSTAMSGRSVFAVTDPVAFPIRGLQLTLRNDHGAFALEGGELGGSMPVGGIAKLCLFAGCEAPPANISVPLDAVGIGGTETASVLVNVTVVGAPWTTATTTTGGLTRTGFAHGVASATTSAVSRPGGLQLVTPVRISTNLAASPAIPGFGIFELASFASEGCRDGIDNATG
ncbi:MAG: hypothetical protein QNK03_02965 [Myxococcota bacterium]|nr:hypothetical protein [Myxococcota bacterium]